MSEVSKWFNEALGLPDRVERSQAMCDLAFDAEQMVRQGRQGDAIELFELLATLDRFDDLLRPAIEIADQHLVSLGARKLQALDVIVEDLHKQFGAMPQRERLLAVAKTLVRDHGRRRPESWAIATQILAAAEAIQPLAGKDLRFRAEVHQQARQ